MVPDIGVSIEDFIYLDAPPSSGTKDGSVMTSQPGSDWDRETTVGHGDFRIGDLPLFLLMLFIFLVCVSSIKLLINVSRSCE